ncbi:hypothetical protein KPL78_22280 [Roseomonas sp. HJA6]|uniref:Phosphoribosylamine--glycine ligase n=1 Tax=Roseomonas alba TaxID=2846776 RepID=A0ABS7AE67_9PROT|nr:hypothetical protein [Neoroseomonas alba]MBW6400603.1 hypothetical protein [Neoroseomonas alba]
MKIRSALPLLGLMVPMIVGCDTGGVWANVPDDPGPVAAQCRREAANSPQYRLYGEMAGGNAANNEQQRQELLVLLPRLYHDCMVRNGADPAGSPAPRDRVTF